ncbi:site-specific DNA-methyltransferase [Gluconobacter morbifer]|uniref:site-specific DNA-methyltransferase (adenine-specific) n=1 Tax=Gluconobacter morbifer G707 TaxID=1088869 RepID=G6XJ29_9PROT|nr:site-specific DNA-methyltransferase [Gluconobacter morbifer]EHH68145.1 DNA methylase N-4/N-6 domain-containing protein [Gluconobacter morbifer G707]
MTDTRKNEFLEALRAEGGSAGNGTLRERLGWDESDYRDVKDALLADGTIASGRGRGGSVRLAGASVVEAPKAASQNTAATPQAKAKPATKGAKTKTPAISSYRHDEATRRNIPTAEFESVMEAEDRKPKTLLYPRNPDLDPQLVWRGKDEQDQAALSVSAPPLYIQEKVHPQALIEDLKRQSRARVEDDAPDLFGDFNGLPDSQAKTEFYRHDQHWSNRMILGDSLQVMASLAEREGLRGKVQCIYFDPPYGIKFNSNFQWSTASREVKDGKIDQVTREPEQVKAFRDTWRDGIHSYLTYLRDRLTIARDLLNESGSIFIQIGSENVHRVRAVMDEVFGEENFIVDIIFQTTPYATSSYLPSVNDTILWYAKSAQKLKYRNIFKEKEEIGSLHLYRSILADDGEGVCSIDSSNERNPKRFRLVSLISPGAASTDEIFQFREKKYRAGNSSHWKIKFSNLERVSRASRIQKTKSSIQFRSFIGDFPISVRTNIWTDTITGSFTDNKIYVVQTNAKVIERCIFMATDPGDLVLDPTCGSGTTAYVAEQWGRRWITIDTSRVALALARSRLMGARYPYYLLADSPEGQRKEAEITRSVPKSHPTHGNIKHGFVYERVPHITLKSIANNAEIDVIWEDFQARLEPLRVELNKTLGQHWEEWEIPREAAADWPEEARKAHEAWWEQRIARQKEIDASIAAKADTEYLYDKPYEDRSKVRVSGPFTVESLSPHRMLAVGTDDQFFDPGKPTAPSRDPSVRDFVTMILTTLGEAGVQQGDKRERITFTSLDVWPGKMLCAEGRFMESETERRAGILIGPEFGTVTKPDLTAAAREAGDAGFDVLISCAFAYEANASEFNSLGRLKVLRARMNSDLHMQTDLKSSGNLFVVFGEPDIGIEQTENGEIRVRIHGVDVFKPSTGEVVSGGPEDIALWMIDTDYNEESFFVRHAYFLGANDPYKALKTTLKAEIDEEAWTSLNSEVSRPFPKPETGRIAVKVINQFGDEVMKVFDIS